MIPSVPCMVCGESHRVSKCSALNPPPPEGIPNPNSSSQLEHSAAQLAMPTSDDGGGKRAGNPEPDDSLSLKHKIASEQEHSQGDESQPTLLEVAP